MHRAEYPHPRAGHRQKSQERQLQSAERKPKEAEHNRAAHPTDQIEIHRKAAHPALVHRPHREGKARSRTFGTRIQPLRHTVGLFVRHRQHTRHETPAVAFHNQCLALCAPEAFHLGARLRRSGPAHRGKEVGKRGRPHPATLGFVRQFRCESRRIALRKRLPRPFSTRLFLRRRQKAVRTHLRFHHSAATQRFDVAPQRLRPPQGLIERAPRRRHIHRFRLAAPAAQLHHLRQQLALFGAHIVESAQIGVESRVETEIAQHQRERHTDAGPQRPMSRRSAPRCHRYFRTLCFGRARCGHFHPVRQQHQHDRQRSHQQRRGKEPQVAQGRSMQRHQSREGADRRDVADEQRRSQFAQIAPHVARVPQVGHEVQRVVDGDAHRHRRNAQHDHRNTRSHRRQHRQSQQPTEADGEQHETNVAHIGEHHRQEGHNEHHRQADRPKAVGFDLPGVNHGDGRRTDLPHLQLHPRAVGSVRSRSPLCLRFHRSRRGIDQRHEARVAPRLAAPRRTLHQHQRMPSVGGENVVVVERKTLPVSPLLQRRPHRGKQLQRVAGKSLFRQVARGHEQRRVEAFHALPHGIGSAHRTFHPTHVGRQQESGHMGIGRRRRAFHARQIHTPRHVRGQMARVGLCQPRGESIDGGHQTVGRCPAEHHRNAIAGVGLRIHRRFVAVARSIGQEIADVFLEMCLPHAQQQGQQRTAHQPPPQQGAHMQPIIETKQEMGHCNRA